MAPALRMTRSIKEKASRFLGHFALSFESAMVLVLSAFVGIATSLQAVKKKVVEACIIRRTSRILKEEFEIESSICRDCRQDPPKIGNPMAREIEGRVVSYHLYFTRSLAQPPSDHTFVHSPSTALYSYILLQ